MSFLADVNLPSPSGTPVSPAAANSFFKLFGGFLAVAAVLVLCMWGLRVLSRRQMGRHKSARLSVLSRVMLGRDNSVALVQAGSRVLAVGVSKDNVSLLCEMTPEECGVSVDSDAGHQEDAGPEPEKKTAPGFWKRFVHNFGVASGLAKGKTPLRPAAKTQGGAASFADLLRTAAENPISGSQTAMESGGFSSAALAASSVTEDTAAPVAPAPVSMPSEERETERPEAALQAMAPKSPVNYAVAVEQMKHRGRLADNEPPVVLQPVRAAGAAYEKMAQMSGGTDTARTGVVYMPSAVLPAAAPGTVPARPGSQRPASASDDEMDRLMERVAARRERLRRPELGKEQA